MTDAEKVRVAQYTLKRLRDYGITGRFRPADKDIVGDTIKLLEEDSTELPTLRREYKRLLEKLENQAVGLVYYQSELAKVSHLLKPLEGWKIVPVVATYKMRQAARGFPGGDIPTLYRVMIEQSPYPIIKE